MQVHSASLMQLELTAPPARSEAFDASEAPAAHSATAASDAADLAACRALLANGSRTFLAASLLLPRAVREPACALYAFCRMADDAVDDVGRDQHAVVRLRERLDRVYRGCPDNIAADRALAVVVTRFAIPRAIPEALLDGFEWDALGTRYDTLEALYAYAARVAGTVGAMMSLLMGVRSAPALARACDLGVAMQLSNIARDVGEDARMGRLYLPRDWLTEAGISPDAWLRNPVFDAALGSVVRRLLDAADALYQRVDAGVAELPPACRPGINAARLLYADIGHEVARRGFNSVDTRAVVSASRKAQLLARALLKPTRRRSGPPPPPLEANRFLVEAASAPVRWPGSQVMSQHPAHPIAQHDALPPWWNLHGRAVSFVGLLERLERRDRMRQPAPLPYR